MKTKLNETQQKIRDFICNHPLCSGLGTEESACTIAAINLVISQKLTDERPECVCPIIYKWVIPIQDAMPDNIRNNGWSQLVPYIAGSKSTFEVETKRKDIILSWMWNKVLPQLTPIAEKYKFKKEWHKMLTDKTADAARAATHAAADADARAAYAAVDAAYAARAARAARAAAYAAVDAAYAAYAARAAADAAAYAAAAAAENFWDAINPAESLENLIDCQ